MREQLVEERGPRGLVRADIEAQARGRVGRKQQVRVRRAHRPGNKRARQRRDEARHASTSFTGFAL